MTFRQLKNQMRNPQKNRLIFILTVLATFMSPVLVLVCHSYLKYTWAALGFTSGVILGLWASVGWFFLIVIAWNKIIEKSGPRVRAMFPVIKMAGAILNLVVVLCSALTFVTPNNIAAKIAQFQAEDYRDFKRDLTDDPSKHVCCVCGKTATGAVRYVGNGEAIRWYCDNCVPPQQIKGTGVTSSTAPISLVILFLPVLAHGIGIWFSIGLIRAVRAKAVEEMINRSSSAVALSYFLIIGNVLYWLLH